MSQYESKSIQNGKWSTQEVPMIDWDDSETTSNNLGNACNNPGEHERTSQTEWTTHGAPVMSQDESRSIQNGKWSTQEVPMIDWDDSETTSNN